MKVHIVNLDPEEDHASARDKISRARAPKIVLVWPRRGNPLNRQLDLVMVQRYANRLGREIGLVTFDPEITAHAQRLQIPVFDSLEQLPSGTWNEPRELVIQPRDRSSLLELRDARETSSQSLYEPSNKGRWIAVGVSIAAVLAILFSILPSAEIVVDPTEFPFEDSLSIWVDPQASTSSNRIPGQWVAAEVSAAKRIPTSGRVRIPVEFAAGEAEIMNLTGEEVTVPAGSGLRAGAERFLTTEEVQLDASEGSMIHVPIEAAEPGASGNVPPGAINSVEGSLGFLITVSNPEWTRGGRNRVTPAVAANDLEDLRQELEMELLDTAERELNAQLDRGHELVPGSTRIANVMEETFDFGLGDVSELVGLSLTLEVEGLSYSTLLALEALQQELIDALPSNRLLVPDSFSAEAIDAHLNGPAMEVRFAAEAELAESIDRDELRRSVVGGPKDEAAERLGDRLKLDRAPLIRTTPNWMPWLPWLGMRIDIKWVWESG